MRNNTYHCLHIAVLLSIILFAALLVSFHCCLSTDTDVYFLYTLSGGFGAKPSALLHYSDIAHPLLAVIVAFFFRYFPWFNWYSFSLLTLIFASSIVLLYSLLNYFRRVYAIVIFGIFFLFLECPLVLRLDFSGAALIGVVCGSISLLMHLKTSNKVWTKRTTIFFIIIFIAGLIRFHYFAFFTLFTVWMSLFVLNRRQLIQFVKIEVLLALLTILFFQGQRIYYQTHIAGWSQEERLRKARIYYVNHPKKTVVLATAGRERLQQQLISMSLTYDTTLTDYSAIKEFGKNNVMPVNMSKDTLRAFYWLFMEIRVYLLLFVSLTIFLMGDRKLLMRYFYMSLFFVVIFLVLGTFFKTTDIIRAAVLGAIFFSAVLIMPRPTSPGKRAWVGIVLLGLSCIWMGIRVVKISAENKDRISMARNIITELNTHNRDLFVAVGPPFNFNLSIWDTPSKYKLSNYIYGELFYSNSYQRQLTRFAVKDLMKEIPSRDDILLVGQKPDPLVDYYREVYRQEVDIKKRDDFKIISAYQIIRQPNQGTVYGK